MDRRSKETEHPLLGVIARLPRRTARDEANVATALVKFHAQVGVPNRHALNLAKHRGRKKGVVVGAQQKSRPTNQWQEFQRARAAIVVRGILKSVHWGRDGVVELEQCPGPFERNRVEEARVALQLAPSFRSERAKEMPGVYAAESLFDEARTAFEVEGHRDDRGSMDLSRKIVAVLAEPLEEHVASEREARKGKRLTRMLAHESLHHVLEIRRLSRMIEPTRTSHLAVARSEKQCVGRPADSLRMGEESAQIVRPDGAFQPV